jgi:hypothetical protein
MRSEAVDGREDVADIGVVGIEEMSDSTEGRDDVTEMGVVGIEDTAEEGVVKRGEFGGGLSEISITSRSIAARSVTTVSRGRTNRLRSSGSSETGRFIALFPLE